jgi:hypothetical protein
LQCTQERAEGDKVKLLSMVIARKIAADGCETSSLPKEELRNKINDILKNELKKSSDKRAEGIEDIKALEEIKDTLCANMTKKNSKRKSCEPKSKPRTTVKLENLEEYLTSELKKKNLSKANLNEASREYRNFLNCVLSQISIDLGDEVIAIYKEQYRKHSETVVEIKLSCKKNGEMVKLKSEEEKKLIETFKNCGKFAIESISGNSCNTSFVVVFSDIK